MYKGNKIHIDKTIISKPVSYTILVKQITIILNLEHYTNTSKIKCKNISCRAMKIPTVT